MSALSLEERAVVALEGIFAELKQANDLKLKELKEEIQPDYVKAKAPEIWVRCIEETEGLLEDNPYLTFKDIPEDSFLRAREGGNMYRERQFRRFVQQHFLPNKPKARKLAMHEYFTLGKANADGPEALARTDSRHCAERALEDRQGWEHDRDTRFNRSSDCRLCKKR